MKITTPAGIIECTVDEYEELVVRGLVPGKEQLIEQNVVLTTNLFHCGLKHKVNMAKIFIR